MQNKMQNKQEFVELLSELGGITKKEALVSLELILEALQKACKESGGVRLVGVGNASVIDVPAKIYKNPKNGEDVPKEATKTIKVKLSKTFIEDTLN